MAKPGDQAVTPPAVRDPSADIALSISSAKAGDRESLGSLVTHCRGYLLAIAHAELEDTLRGKLAVSDVVQETLLRVQQKFSGFRGSSENELLSWIRQILIHYIADVRRSYRQTDKRQIGREIQFPWMDHSTAFTAARLAVDSATPGRAAAAGEELDRLRSAIAGLSEEYRTVLLLRTWERLPFAEVGNKMNRSTDAARMLWTRAVQQLTLQLQSENDESS